MGFSNVFKRRAGGIPISAKHTPISFSPTLLDQALFCLNSAPLDPCSGAVCSMSSHRSIRSAIKYMEITQIYRTRFRRILPAISSQLFRRERLPYLDVADSLMQLRDLNFCAGPLIAAYSTTVTHQTQRSKEKLYSTPLNLFSHESRRSVRRKITE